MAGISDIKFFEFLEGKFGGYMIYFELNLYGYADIWWASFGWFDVVYLGKFD